MTTPSPARPTTVREIPEGESLRRFIDLTWTFNAADPAWVSPVRMSVAAALDRSKHPFHRHAEVAYFIAERNGSPVGRIAAIVNRLHNEFHGDRVGFVGLFECENDAATAGALFGAAESWLRSRGMEQIRGPVNLSTNDEVASPGVLVAGFETPPYFMMGHNPRYYADLFDQNGFQGAKDLIAFLMDDPEAMPEIWGRMIDKLLARHGATVRSVEMSRFREDLDAIKEVYNAAWSKNWGFVPMTDAEFEHLAKEFKPFVDPEMCQIAEVDGEPIGFSLAMPDLNEALRHLPNGRLFPFGFVKFLWHKRKVRGIRVMTVGLKPRYHHSGLGLAFYLRTWMNGRRLGYVRGEGSWILEDNLEMVRALERIDAAPYKRYRIYERTI